MNLLRAILLSSAIALLSGCTLLDAYLMAGYDNQEYFLINKIRTKAQITQKLCDNPQSAKVEVQEIVNTAIEFRNYTQHIPRNPEPYKMAGQMVDLAQQVKFDNTTSPVFCKMKLQQIERNADKIQQVLGSKPR